MSRLGLVIVTFCMLAAFSACHQEARCLAEAESLLQEGVELRKEKQTDAAAERFSQALLKLDRCNGQHPEVRRLKGRLKDNLGAMYWKNGLNEESLALHLEAMKMLETTGDSTALALALRNAARVSATLQNMEDAESYYQQALAIAQHLHDTVFANETCLEIANDLYLDNGDFEQAIALANKALLNGSDSSFCHLVMGMAYYYLERDSLAMSYFNEAVKSPKASIRMAAYQGMGIISEASGDYPQALEYQKCYNDNLVQSDQEYKTKELMQIKSDYDLQLQTSTLKAEQKLKSFYLYLVVGVLLVALLLTLLLLRQRTLKNRLRVEETKNQLETAMSKNKVYLSALALSEQITASTLDFNLEPQDWDDYVALVDTLYEGFVRQLQQQYPLLNKGDLPMCCLTKQGFSNQVISILLNMQIASYARRKSRIKQEKMNGLNDPRPFEEMIHSL